MTTHDTKALALSLLLGLAGLTGPAALAADPPAAPPAEAEAEEPMAITPQQVQRWEMELTASGQHCKTLIEQDLLDECTKLLADFEGRLPAIDHPEIVRIKKVLEIRRQLIQDTLKLPPLDPEKPDNYYSALFKMYGRIPEEFFPFDEVMPYWQAWMLSESAQRRFTKYKIVRVLARSTDAKDDTLEVLFYQQVQQRFLDYGFKLVDLSTTAPPSPRETLVKMSLEGHSLDNVADAALGQGHYALTADITSLRYTGPDGQRLPPRTWKIVETSADANMARDETIKRLAPQIADAVFFLTLKQMFPS